MLDIVCDLSNVSSTFQNILINSLLKSYIPNASNCKLEMSKKLSRILLKISCLIPVYLVQKDLLRVQGLIDFFRESDIFMNKMRSLNMHSVA